MGVDTGVTPRMLVQILMQASRYDPCVLLIMNKLLEDKEFDHSITKIRFRAQPLYGTTQPEILIQALKQYGKSELKHVEMRVLSADADGKVGIEFVPIPNSSAPQLPTRITEQQMRDILRAQATAQQTEMEAHVAKVCDLVHAKILANTADIKDNRLRIGFSETELRFISGGMACDVQKVFYRAAERNFDLPSIVSCKPDVYLTGPFLAVVNLQFKTE